MSFRSTGPGRTYTVALALLGLLACGQILAAFWAGYTGRGFGREVEGSGQKAGPLLASTDTSRNPVPVHPALPLPPRTGTGTGTTGGPGLSPAAANPAPPVPSSLEGPRLLLPPDKTIDDIAVLEAMELGIEARRDGDTQAALAAFRRADTLQQGNPAILHEMARTYDDMGLAENAAALWNQIIKMGEGGAGDYYALAEVQLGQAGVAISGEQKTYLRLGKVLATRNEEQQAGEEVLLRIPVLRGTDEAIDSQKVMLYVYFFDLVDGTRIEKTTADQPKFRWTSLPLDWSDGEVPEILEVLYFHPRLAEAEERLIGSHAYHGYIVKLYYQDELQDMLAEPRTLYDEISSQEPPRLDDTLFPLSE